MEYKDTSGGKHGERTCGSKHPKADPGWSVFFQLFHWLWSISNPLFNSCICLLDLNQPARTIGEGYWSRAAYRCSLAELRVKRIFIMRLGTWSVSSIPSTLTYLRRLQCLKVQGTTRIWLRKRHDRAKMWWQSHTPIILNLKAFVDFLLYLLFGSSKSVHLIVSEYRLWLDIWCNCIHSQPVWLYIIHVKTDMQYYI